MNKNEDFRDKLKKKFLKRKKQKQKQTPLRPTSISSVPHLNY